MEYKKDGLIINYKEPDYCDAQMLLGLMNIGSLEENKNANWGFLIIASASRHINFLIEKIIVDESEKEYAWLLTRPEYSGAITNITADILQRVMEFSAEKKRD